jgi:hypothetical protein
MEVVAREVPVFQPLGVVTLALRPFSAIRERTKYGEGPNGEHK